MRETRTRPIRRAMGGAATIATAANEVSAGHVDLAGRTEPQATETGQSADLLAARRERRRRRAATAAR